MTTEQRIHPDPRSARLWVEERAGEERRLWSESVGSPPPVYGERWTDRGGHWLRAWVPTRSKLAAALEVGWEGPLPAEGQRWLYLGAATGTTSSHVADLLGPEGALYAVEKSPRPFQKLLRFAERWPNVRPILADVRSLDEEPFVVPLVDGLYADLPQPDQVELVLRAARRFLKEGGILLLALKTASMGRELSAPMHLERAEQRLGRFFELERTVRLAPWHRGHYFIGGEARPGFDTMDGTFTPPSDSRAPGVRSPRPHREAGGRDRRSGRGSGRWGPRSGPRERSA